MTIRIGTMFPGHLDLNGDQGNVKVLERQLAWRGVDFATIKVESKEDLKDLDFLFMGHGSAAAWNQIRADVRVILGEIQRSGASLPILAVSSGYELLKDSGFFPEIAAPIIGPRVSKFEITSFEGSEFLGYVNTESSLPTFARNGNQFGTMLHGPVLSRNSNLVEQLLRLVCDSAGVQTLPALPNEKAGQLADLVSEIWKLERELASE